MNLEKEKTVAIIVRRNRDIERVLSLLEANGIPASAERGADIFAHPVGMLFFSLLLKGSGAVLYRFGFTLQNSGRPKKGS